MDLGIGALAALPELSEINLAGAPLQAKGLKSLVTFKSLRLLVLGRTSLTDEAVEELAKTGMRIEELSIEENPKITDDSLKAIGEWDGVKMLLAERTRVTDSGLKYLLKTKNLKEVRLGNARITVKGAADFARQRPDIKVDMSW